MISAALQLAACNVWDLSEWSQRSASAKSAQSAQGRSRLSPAKSWDWQQLIEMCRVVDTVLVDQDVYALRHGNDRLDLPPFWWTRAHRLTAAAVILPFALESCSRLPSASGGTTSPR